MVSHSESPATTMTWENVIEVLDVPIDGRGRLNRNFKEHANKIVKVLILKPDGAKKSQIDLVAEKMGNLTIAVERLTKMMVMNDDG